MLNLIITADDYGYNSERNLGIKYCLENGAVSRTSAMVNGLACLSGRDILNNLPKKATVGLHLNLTEGRPLQCHSSLRQYGFFSSKQSLTMLLDDDDVIKKSEVKSEIILQINKFKELFGLYPPYVDGHHHVHVFPGIVRDVLASVMSELNIREVRMPHDGTFDEARDDATLNETADGSLRDFLMSVNTEAEKAKSVYKHHSIKFSDHFFGLSTMGLMMTEDKIKNILLKMRSEATNSKTPNKITTCELMAHPGYPCTDPTRGGCGEGADQFAQSTDRLHELNVLNSTSLKQFYRDNNIHLISLVSS
ncbi:hypothetical protein HELRODRAFT_79617 [Helobdella robusta]|uniref:Carbohydrate deacetylase n=1 Tax=Helobdella robusta TaxID=6412 RepID=T1G3R1_HELRO|nr:hypothetical protein HELRODRAFT_79617 [Helobdella robusta]ESO03991.1 hypothetical protein HELRODRAFT_79617 [Helobdella robusta]